MVTSASIIACMTCSPAPTARDSKPSCMFSTISAIATLTCSGISGGVAFTDWFWLLFFMVVPCCWCVLADARYLPHGRNRARDRHFNFYETRDNLR